MVTPGYVCNARSADLKAGKQSVNDARAPIFLPSEPHYIAPNPVHAASSSAGSAATPTCFSTCAESVPRPFT